LDGLSLDIKPGERIAVVGRTGAGKSSLISCLFRLCELEGGSIKIDNIAISQVGLKALRRRIAIVPQDPVLFYGSLRFNLDPHNQNSDAQIWQVLEMVSMKNLIMQSESKLEMRIDSDATNFSVGQRQLLCLGRAILCRARILIIDEATANVDVETDRLIQQSLRMFTKGSTLITIAHRLDTIMDYDRVLVMSAGRAVEFDSPEKLLDNSFSEFSKMVAKTKE
jgi:ABC-type multidrug transport system fused ATPase/permease subunit